MKASEMITLLQQAVDKHGDCEVFMRIPDEWSTDLKILVITAESFSLTKH